jgi:hypothetical protein
VRFWLEERAENLTWRGCVVEVSGETEIHVEDGAALVSRISRQLLKYGGVAFPHASKRDPDGNG